MPLCIFGKFLVNCHLCLWAGGELRLYFCAPKFLPRNARSARKLPAPPSPTTFCCRVRPKPQVAVSGINQLQPQARAFCLGGAKNRDGAHNCNPLQPPCTAKLMTFAFQQTKNYQNKRKTNFLENNKQKPTKNYQNKKKSTKTNKKLIFWKVKNQNKQKSIQTIARAIQRNKNYKNKTS